MVYKNPEQQREYQRQWRAARRAEFFKDKVCVRCESSDSLELDHIDGKTKVSHNIWSWSESRREAELAKCQVLCHDCHSEKTRFDRLYTGHKRLHGTNARYCRGCKCKRCKAAHAAYNRDNRRKN